MNGVKIGEIIKELRGRKGISQEMLADVCGVSMQAVSKWENGQCYPDITFLPVLSKYFQVTLDYLLMGRKTEPDAESEEMDGRIMEMLENKTEKDVLYIVQYRNGRIIDKKSFNDGMSQKDKEPVLVQFEEEFKNMKNGLNVQIWGYADITGDVYGCVDAGGMVNCAEIYGSVDAGGTVNCTDINGSVDAGGSINCASVNGSVSAGGAVNCGDVSGNVEAGTGVSCRNVGGDVEAGCEVQCGDISGNVEAGLNVLCSSVNGEIDE